MQFTEKQVNDAIRKQYPDPNNEWVLFSKEAKQVVLNCNKNQNFQDFSHVYQGETSTSYSCPLFIANFEELGKIEIKGWICFVLYNKARAYDEGCEYKIELNFNFLPYLNDIATRIDEHKDELDYSTGTMEMLRIGTKDYTENFKNEGSSAKDGWKLYADKCEKLLNFIPQHDTVTSWQDLCDVIEWLYHDILPIAKSPALEFHP